KMRLKTARDKAAIWRQMIAEGLDPAKEEEKAAAAQARRLATTFTSVAELFIEHEVKGTRTADDVAREIRKELVGRWGNRPITDIGPEDIVGMCDDMRKRGIGSHGRNVLNHASRLFRWAVARRIYGLERSPCDGLSPRVLIGERKSRNRVLTNEEL